MSDTNYKCSVTKLGKLTKHPTADRLQIANIFGNTVIVGNDVKEGDLGLFFPLEAKIGEEFLKANSLYRDKTLNTDQTHAGFFEKSGRVRAMKLRGIPSMGYWCELKYLRELVNFTSPSGIKISSSWATFESKLKEGDSFNEIHGFQISTKYIPKTKVSVDSRMISRKKHDRFIKDQFKEHTETEHLFKNLDRIKPEDQLVITWKLHGTSARAGNVLVKRKLSLLEKTLRFFGVKIQDTEYSCLYGSRKVIKDINNPDHKHFYEKDLWTEVGKSNFEGKLNKGESIYYEIVGYVPGTQSLIQKGFAYGCKEGQCEVYVYRITNTNSDGISVDLGWEAIKGRCTELGIKHVPEAIVDTLDMAKCEYRDLDLILHTHCGTLEEGTINNPNYFQDGIKKFYLERMSVLDPNTIEEGIAVRVEGLNPKIFKVKSFMFLQKETEMLDQEITDMETEQTEIN